MTYECFDFAMLTGDVTIDWVDLDECRKRSLRRDWRDLVAGSLRYETKIHFNSKLSFPRDTNRQSPSEESEDIYSRRNLQFTLHSSMRC
jgi:hypothetical protein